jgi:hypothetical protein
MKHIVSNPFHGWVHQTTDWQANSGRTCSFNRLSAYSYRAEIGRIVTNEAGQRAYLVSTESWSVTTSGHQRALARAIPSSSTVFNVANFDLIPSRQVNEYMNRIAELQLKAKRARRYRDSHLSHADSILDELKSYAKFYGLELPESAFNLDSIVEQLEAAKKAEAARQKEADKQARVRAQESIDRWIAGEPVSIPYTVKEAFLRLKSDGLTVETSHHAEVPLEHVQKAIPCVLRVMRSGHAWTPNGCEIRLGYYNVRSIDSKGMQVGCHYFTRAEVERFSALVTPVQSMEVPA